MPQPGYGDGGWYSPSRFVYGPEDRLEIVRRCTCRVVTGGHLAVQPSCEIHGTAARTTPDLIIDGKPYRGELIFPELEHLRDDGTGE